MALLIENTERRLLPIWKSFNNSFPELQPIRPSNMEKGDISPFIYDWRSCKNLANAGDLISAAIVNARTDVEEVIEAANYILYSHNTPSFTLSKVSKSILQIDNYETEDNRTLSIYAKIAKIKELLIKYPTDAILHIEIARNYLLLGQLQHAKSHIETALYFDCHNRYIIRCAARFYVHLKEHEKALRVVRSSSLIKIDPWLMASEIGISQVLNKTSKNIKKGLSIIDSRNYNAFDITELCSAIGTQELMYGAYSKSRKLFMASLMMPNSNSLAQAKWVSNENNLDLNFEGVDFNSGHFWEAKCYNSFKMSDFQQSFDFAKRWIEQEPYSTRAILQAYGLSITYLHDLTSGQEIMEGALKTHIGNPVFINNYAYALALDGKIDEAERAISTIKKIDLLSTNTTDICLTATKGMIAFRKGDVQNGMSLYFNAIEKSKNRTDDPELNHLALLNFCREILVYENSAENRSYVINILEKLPKDEENKELTNIMDQIYGLLMNNE